MKNFNKILGGGLFLLLSAGIQADQVILDDLIVDGSACIGFDCVNGESFGFDTIRVKENNLRIRFVDTSSTASFPSRDWQLTANDSANGGANKFSIDDIDGGRTPFTIEAGAPSHSLYVDDGGRLGLGTSIPVVDIHLKTGNTPTLRLDQDGSSGFTPQTWDVAGNEANFFIRDATNGSTLPFRIFPGAPSNALSVAANGNIGLGISNPEQHLHVHSTDGSAQVLIEDINGTVAARTLLKLENKGNTKFSLVNTDTGSEWSFANPGDSLRLSKQGSGIIEMELFSNGNMTIAGALTQLSDVNAKTAISELDPEVILSLVAQLPVTRWEYKNALGEKHIGPMAQDFYAAFGLGASEIGISTIDTAGVALVAIQALVEKNKSLEIAIEELRRENQTIAARQQEKLDKVDQLEQMVNQLIQAQENARVLTSLN